MTQHDQYTAPPVAPQQYEQPGHGYPQPGHQPQKTNTMAVLGLVFAFVFSPLGVVFSAIGLKQTKERREGGRGLALAGLILSIVFLLIGILVAVLMLAVVAPAVEQATQAAAAEDPTGVAAACEIIEPAFVDLDSQLTTVTTPDGYAQVMAALGAAMEAAASQTTDPEFIAHVQTMSGDFQQAADAVSNGQDPAFLQDALSADGAAIDADCAAAGYVG